MIDNVCPMYISRRHKRITVIILVAVAILTLGWYVWAWIWGNVVTLFLNVLAAGWY